MARLVPRRRAAQPRDLRGGHAPAVVLVADGAELAGAVPAAQGVGAHVESAGRFAEREVVPGHLPKHCIGAIGPRVATRLRSTPMKLSVLDQSPISEGMTGADALHNTLDLAKLADE